MWIVVMQFRPQIEIKDTGGRCLIEISNIQLVNYLQRLLQVIRIGFSWPNIRDGHLSAITATGEYYEGGKY